VAGYDDVAIRTIPKTVTEERVSRLFAVVWAAFVLGGMAVGWVGLSNMTLMAQTEPGRPTGAAGTVAGGTATAQPLAFHPPQLRDFTQEAPPFAPAGESTAGQTPQPTQVASPSGRLTVLLMGIDQRPDEAAQEGGDPGRSDSMMLVSIDYEAHTAALASIPRDGFVVIPGHGNERINSAYTFGEIDRRGGGPGLAKQTVSQLFGVPVDRYALVDIHSTERLIDTLGGVWIDSPTRLVDHEYPTDDYRVMTIDIPAGRQLMDGETAVEYARTRHPDSDYGRQARQQQVVMAIRDRALQLDVVPRLPGLLPDMLKLVHTDMSPVEILQLATFGRGLNRDRDIVSLPPNGDLTPGYIGGGGASYINLTPAYRAAVRRLVTAPQLAAEHAQVSVLNAGAPVGTGGAVSEVLRAAGMVVTRVDAVSPQPASRIEAGPAVQHSAELIATLLRLPSASLVSTDDPGDEVRVVLGPDAKLPPPAR